MVEYIITRVCFRNARLIRRPFDQEHQGSAWGFTTGRYCRLEAHGSDGINLDIGLNCQLNDAVHIAAADSIVIGDDVLIASRAGHGLRPCPGCEPPGRSRSCLSNAR